MEAPALHISGEDARAIYRNVCALVDILNTDPRDGSHHNVMLRQPIYSLLFSGMGEPQLRRLFGHIDHFDVRTATSYGRARPEHMAELLQKYPRGVRRPQDATEARKVLALGWLKENASAVRSGTTNRVYRSHLSISKLYLLYCETSDHPLDLRNYRTLCEQVRLRKRKEGEVSIFSCIYCLAYPKRIKELKGRVQTDVVKLDIERLEAKLAAHKLLVRKLEASLRGVDEALRRDTQLSTLHVWIDMSSTQIIDREKIRVYTVVLEFHGPPWNNGISRTYLNLINPNVGEIKKGALATRGDLVLWVGLLLKERGWFDRFQHIIFSADAGGGEGRNRYAMYGTSMLAAEIGRPIVWLFKPARHGANICDSHISQWKSALGAHLAVDTSMADQLLNYETAVDVINGLYQTEAIDMVGRPIANSNCTAVRGISAYFCFTCYPVVDDVATIDMRVCLEDEPTTVQVWGELRYLSKKKKKKKKKERGDFIEHHCLDIIVCIIERPQTPFQDPYF